MRRLTYRWAALALVVARVATAQSAPPNLDIETVYLDPAGRGALTVGNGETLKSATFRVGLGFGYQYGHLQYSTRTTSGAIVLRDRIDAQLYGAVGITDWLELGATLPVTIGQFTQNRPFEVAVAGLGTPQLHARFGILDDTRPLFLSLGLTAGLPLGSAPALNNQGFWVQPRLNLGKRFRAFQLSGEISALVRNNQVALREWGGSYWDHVGNVLAGSVAVTTLGEKARGELTLRATAPLQQGWVGFEGLLGLRVLVKKTEFFVALGPGFGGSPNTPGFRVYAGASYGNADPPRRPCVETDPYEVADCPDLDKDHDGVKNSLDKAPLEAEDKDGFQDDDGAPDLDNDRDQVPDLQDTCPNVSGSKDNHGCPDTDADGDGVVDRLDRCPDKAEDKDGFEDDDGCPDLDDDGDGIADTADACPKEKGIAEERGCPAKDTDGDGVVNHLDNCPELKGDPANAGCPAADKQLVVITREQLKILDTVRFATGKAALLPASNRLLDQIASVLSAQRRITLVQIEGHTDDVGVAAKNQTLSEERAAAVRAYLVKKGIAPERLKAVGFGSQRPLQSNATAKGKEANRRVEFNIVAQE